MKERDPISEEDEALLWEKGILGCNSVKSLFRTIYFYNGKLFGLRSKEHRNLRYSNFSIDLESVTYDESVSKTYHGGLEDLRYKPRVVKHGCCAGKDIGHNRCIVKCMLATPFIRQKSKKLHAMPKHFILSQMPVGINTLNKVINNNP